MLKAKGRGGHGVHSPLMYELITQALAPQKEFYAFDDIELQRTLLLNSKEIITIEDFGAGSRHHNRAKRSISSMARHALQSPSNARALARIVHHYNPKNILELGASFGITTSYLANANRNAQVFTIEGATSVARKAQEVFRNLSIQNVQLIMGNMDEVLIDALKEIKRVDFVLMDGNHRYEPTLRYFDWLKPFVHEDTIIVLDDIHWSSEMEQAWKELIQLPDISVSVDFFHFGIVFFKKGRQKEHFIYWLP